MKKWPFSVCDMQDVFKVDIYLLKPSVVLGLRFDRKVYTKNRPLLAILSSFKYPLQVSKKSHSYNFWQFLQNKVRFWQSRFLHRLYQRWLFIWYILIWILGLSDLERFWLFICSQNNQPFLVILPYSTHENMDSKKWRFFYSRKFVWLWCIRSFTTNMSTRIVFDSYLVHK